MNAILDTNDVTTSDMPIFATTTQERITTTLYDLISTVQSFVESDDDRVVAIVQRLLHSGRVTWSTNPVTSTV